MSDENPVVRVAICDPAYTMHLSPRPTFHGGGPGRVFDLVGHDSRGIAFRASVLFDGRHGFRLIPKAM